MFQDQEYVLHWTLSEQYVMAIKCFTAHPDHKPTRGWVSAMGKIQQYQHYKKAVKSDHVCHPNKKGRC